MCNQCERFSRRDILRTATFAATAALTACTTETPISRINPSPTPYDQLEGEGPKPPIPDSRPIIVPPPAPPLQTDTGSIMPRRAWTTVPMEFNRGRPMNGVKLITLHHSGDGKPFLETSIPDVAKHLQSVQRAHFQRGMINIAYHFAVDRAGRVWQLRSLRYEGQHVRIGKNGIRWNEHNIGIVTLGDFNLQSPSTLQTANLFTFIRLVRSKYALPPAAVHMHGELVQTDCPGQHLAPLIRTARANHIL